MNERISKETEIREVMKWQLLIAGAVDAAIRGVFFMRRRPIADRLLSACRTAAHAAERILSWHFLLPQ